MMTSRSNFNSERMSRKRLAPQTDLFRKDGLSESRHQVILFQWAELNLRKYPELRWLHSIPNAPKLGKTADVLTRKIRGAQMNREGRKAGVFDLCLPVKRDPYSGLYVEMKIGTNGLTEKQAEFQEFVEAQGFKTAVCYGFNEAADAIERYLENRH